MTNKAGKLASSEEKTKRRSSLVEIIRQKVNSPANKKLKQSLTDESLTKIDTNSNKHRYSLITYDTTEEIVESSPQKQLFKTVTSEERQTVTSEEKNERRTSLLEIFQQKVNSHTSKKRRQSFNNEQLTQDKKRKSLVVCDMTESPKKRVKKSGEEKLLVPEGENPRINSWNPPVSAYGLIQEQLFRDPWKVLVACMMLNRTSGRQVHHVIWDLFQLCPSAEKALKVSKEQIVEIIRPLGIHTKRANDMLTMSQQYLNKNWRSPLELHGVGKYASDAYWIFCKGRWREVQPRDKELNKYHEWLHETDGLGCGFQPDNTQIEKLQ